MSVAPITKMPAEILGEIFQLLSPGTIVIPSSDFDILWAAAETCSKWRDIALGMCHLWNDLSINFQGKLRSDRTTVYFAKQCLQRSQNAPLFLQITEQNSYASYGISFLIPHSARIRRLSIRAEIQLSFVVLPNLECLYMKSLPYHYTLLEQAPALVELRVDDELPLKVMQWISQGSIWPALRLLECKVSSGLLDTFLDMLEARAGDGSVGSPSRIADVVVGYWDFKVRDEQWEKVHSLRSQGIRISVEEPVCDIFENLDEAGSTAYDNNGYDSDKTPSLGI